MAKPTLHMALTKCFFCLESSDIILDRRISVTSKVNEMHNKVVSMNPCPNCKSLMDQGIVLITFDPSKSDPNWYREKMPNPYRTGGFFVIREEALSKFLTDKEMIDWCLKYRWMFIEHEAAERLGLFEIPEKESE